MQEVDTIKEAIVEGRLWELVELRCRSHPSLLEALRRLGKHKLHLASAAPSTKRRGILFFDPVSLHRPEYTTQIERILHQYAPPREARIALLMPQTHHRSEYAGKAPDTNTPKTQRGIHVCLYSPPYGLIPSELENSFPFSQTETQEDPDPETLKAMSESVQAYLAKNRNYEMLIFLHSGKRWQVRLMRMCKRACNRTKTRFHSYANERIPRGRIEILGRGTNQVRALYKRRRV
jgi:predicted RNA-binding protein